MKQRAKRRMRTKLTRTGARQIDEGWWKLAGDFGDFGDTGFFFKQSRRGHL